MILDRARNVQVDDTGIHLTGGQDVIFDVLFDDARTWSFTPTREDRQGLRWHVAWPDVLVKYLDGTTRVTVRTHADHTVVHDAEVTFGHSDERLQVVDSEGRPLSVTKYGRLNRPFDSLAEETKAHYLDQVEEVLSVIHEGCALPAFVSWGTLLGAVRTGGLIGHDVDVDLAWYSEHDAPVDVIRESYVIERALRAKGWSVRRENGAFLALFLPQSDGSTRNLDVFGSWHTDGWFYLVHDARARLPRSSVLPLGTVELEHRIMPAPADTPSVLAACYGESWRVPDPSFSFNTAPADLRRIDGWLGGMRQRRDRWARVHGEAKPNREPSAFARWVADRDLPEARLLDLGCGDAADSLWLARDGRQVIGIDHVPAVVARGKKAAERLGLTTVDLRCLNLLDLRATLALGTEMACETAPTLYARQLLCELGDTARHDLWRVARMSLRGGGSLFVEVHTHPTQLGGRAATIRCPGMGAKAVRRGARANGFSILDEESVTETEEPSLHRFHLQCHGEST